MEAPYETHLREEDDSSFYTAKDDAPSVNTKVPPPSPSTSSAGSEPVDPKELRLSLGLLKLKALEDGTQTTADPTVDSSLAETVENMMTLRVSKQSTDGRPVFASDDDDLFGIPEQEERDSTRGRYEKLKAEIVETNENSKLTKKAVQELQEETAMNHADTMHGQDEIKDTLEEKHDEMLWTEAVHHLETQGKVENVQKQIGDIIKVMGTMGADITSTPPLPMPSSPRIPRRSRSLNRS